MSRLPAHPPLSLEVDEEAPHGDDEDGGSCLLALGTWLPFSPDAEARIFVVGLEAGWRLAEQHHKHGEFSEEQRNLESCGKDQMVAQSVRLHEPAFLGLGSRRRVTSNSWTAMAAVLGCQISRRSPWRSGGARCGPA